MTNKKKESKRSFLDDYQNICSNCNEPFDYSKRGVVIVTDTEFLEHPTLKTFTFCNWTCLADYANEYRKT